MSKYGGSELASNARKRVPVLPRHSDRPKKKSQEDETPRTLVRESIAVSLFAVAAFILISLYSNLSGASFAFTEDAQQIIRNPKASENTVGLVGQLLSEFLIGWLGWCSFVTAIWALLLSRNVWKFGWPSRINDTLWGFFLSFVGSLFMVVSCAIMASVFFGYSGGGRIGAKLSILLINYVNQVGALLIAFVVFIVSLGISTGIGTSRIITLSTSILSYLQTLLFDAAFALKAILYRVASGNAGFLRFLAKVTLSLASIIQKLIMAVVLLPLRLFNAITFPIRWFFKIGSVNNTVENVAPSSDKFVLGNELDSKVRVLRSSSRHDEQKNENSISIELLKTKKTLTQRLHIARKNKDKRIKKRSSSAGGLKRVAVSKFHKSPFSNYKLPPLSLLEYSNFDLSLAPHDQELIDNSKKLEQTLSDFRIGGKIVEVHPGPIITLYQFQPAAGVKVQRIISLADDLALSLKVAAVRVYAPVPGKGTVGIEVPNSQRETVMLRDILDSEEYEKYEGDLKLALAKTTFGEPYVTDLARMPHLLIAGATGTGKSVCINSILLSLLTAHSPEDLQLILIDPKMLELSMYENIPHLKAPVVTNAKRARGVLWWAVEEMERRYVHMKDMGVRNLACYNKALEGEAIDEDNDVTVGLDSDSVIELGEKQIVAAPDAIINNVPTFHPKEKLEHKRMPAIVIVVDELADLMLTVGREIEELITRLAQKARAAGIHLILATQRPSVNVITGLIKANFSARISFQVASRIDARTVMDTSGAEKLLGKGDMLFLAPGTGRIRRLHAPFVSDKEVYDVVAFIRRQGGPQYDTAIEEMIKRIEDRENSEGGGETSDGDYDDLYDQAVNLVIEKGQASTSMVQRYFRIGYNRAARILETMEKEGLVGPADGAKPRQVINGANMR
ncbi:MAG: DNA translocase FtsK 4TM domain-containing protein [Deltaproteobacteria bacterium]|nr:DNA translocase FtsK 4TM domain-containing protein [Deltaproteobacteria bacterium]